jgi:CRP-like cAMP-binding protein
MVTLSMFTPNQIEFLIKTDFFKGLSASEAERFLACSGARLKTYPKKQTIIREQENVADIGIILSGTANAFKYDAGGKQVLISQVCAGSSFGEVLAAAGSKKSPVTVVADSGVTAVLIPFSKASNLCAKTCGFHAQILSNLFGIISAEYFELFNRINCIIRPTLREKILFYLSFAAKGANGNTFNIPFNRAALAQYLNADRSALSRELAHMKKDGLIDYYKNSFVIKSTSEY